MKVHEQFPFILCANRDEFYARDTKEAHFWDENPSLLAGKDLEKGGTWLGLSEDGEVAALTNVRSYDKQEVSSTTSRGEIVSSYFNDRKYFQHILEKKSHYSGFNLLYGTIHKLVYTTNQSYKDQVITSGIHILSNATLNSPWPKAMKLEQGLREIQDLSKDELTDYLFHLLSLKEPFPDVHLPDTGVGLTLERQLSPIHILTEKYGTKSSTLILVDTNGKVTFIERTYESDKKDIEYSFLISPEKR